MLESEGSRPGLVGVHRPSGPDRGSKPRCAGQDRLGEDVRAGDGALAADPTRDDRSIPGYGKPDGWTVGNELFL